MAGPDADAPTRMQARASSCLHVHASTAAAAAAASAAAAAVITPSTRSKPQQMPSVVWPRPHPPPEAYAAAKAIVLAHPATLNPTAAAAATHGDRVGVPRGRGAYAEYALEVSAIAHAMAGAMIHGQ